MPPYGVGRRRGMMTPSIGGGPYVIEAEFPLQRDQEERSRQALRAI